jgi:hypothetical protein
MESKMHSVEMSDAEKLVDCIRDHKSPGAAKDALAVCDRWLREDDDGGLHMSQAVRSLLETAQLADE